MRPIPPSPPHLPDKLSQVGSGINRPPEAKPYPRGTGKKVGGSRILVKCIPKRTDTSTPAPRYPLHMRADDKGLQRERSGLGNQGQCKHSPGPDSTCHPGEQQRERQAPGRLHTGRGVGSFLVPSPSGPGTQRGHRLVSASLVRTLVLRAAGRLCGSQRRGNSRAGELGNVWSSEWLGAPWRDTLLGEALGCTSEGVAAEHIWLGPASRSTREASTLFSHP